VVFRFGAGHLVEVVECQNDLKHDEGHLGSQLRLIGRRTRRASKLLN
jgi:hypothetical protein